MIYFLLQIGAAAAKAGLRSLLAVWMGGGGVVSTGSVVIDAVGVQATAAVGTVTATGDAVASPAGVEAASAVGTAIASSVTPSVRSLLAPWVGGGGAPVGVAVASPGGVEATGSVGAVVATGTGAGAGAGPPDDVAWPGPTLWPTSVDVFVRGVAARASVGRVQVHGGHSATVEAIGVEAQAAVGRAALDALAAPVGVAATTAVGRAEADGQHRASPRRRPMPIPSAAVTLAQPAQDTMDLAWSALQRERDDEETLVALGVFDP